MALLCSSVIADQGTLSDPHELLLLLAAVVLWVTIAICFVFNQGKASKSQVLLQISAFV